MLLEIRPTIARNPDVPSFMQGKRCDKVGFTVVTPVKVQGEETVEQNLNCSPSVAGTNVCNHIKLKSLATFGWVSVRLQKPEKGQLEYAPKVKVWVPSVSGVAIQECLGLSR